MDQTTIDLMISNQNTIHADTKDLQKRIDDAQEKTDQKLGEVQKDVSKIASCIVGQDRCVQNMEKLTTRIEDVTMICQRNVTVIESLTDEVDDYGPRLQCLENQKIIVDYQKGLVNLGWKTITSSSLLSGASVVLMAILTGVYWGRVNDLIALYGIHITIIIICAIVIILGLTWLGRRKMASAMHMGKSLKWWFI